MERFPVGGVEVKVAINGVGDGFQAPDFQDIRVLLEET